MKNTKMKELLQKLGTLMALAILVLIFCITMPDKFMKVGGAFVRSISASKGLISSIVSLSPPFTAFLHAI